MVPQPLPHDPGRSPRVPLTFFLTERQRDAVIRRLDRSKRRGRPRSLRLLDALGLSDLA